MSKKQESKLDAFQVLGLNRALALDEEELHGIYVSRGREVHPDHGGNEAASAQVNLAYELLRYPDSRLKHLMDLSAPEGMKKWRTVPLDDVMMGVFGHLSTALQKAGALTSKLNGAQTALAKALLAQEVLRVRDELENLGSSLENLKESLTRGFPEMDQRLANHDEMVWQEIAITQAKLAYLGRWQRQIREALLPLMID